MDFLKSTKGGPFGSAGGRIPERGTSAPPPPPKSAPAFTYTTIEADSIVVCKCVVNEIFRLITIRSIHVEFHFNAL